MIDRIKISREFKDSILGGLWLGVEATIDEREDVTSAFIKANEELINAYGRLSGGGFTINYDVLKDIPYNEQRMYNGSSVGRGTWRDGDNIPTGTVPTIKVDPKEEKIKDFLEAIQTSTTLKGVEIFRKLVERENNPSLTEAFETKIKELISV